MNFKFKFLLIFTLIVNAIIFPIIVVLNTKITSINLWTGIISPFNLISSWTWNWWQILILFIIFIIINIIFLIPILLSKKNFQNIFTSIEILLLLFLDGYFIYLFYFSLLKWTNSNLKYIMLTIFIPSLITIGMLIWLFFNNKKVKIHKSNNKKNNNQNNPIPNKNKDNDSLNSKKNMDELKVRAMRLNRESRSETKFLASNDYIFKATKNNDNAKLDNNKILPTKIKEQEKLDDFRISQKTSKIKKIKSINPTDDNFQEKIILTAMPKINSKKSDILTIENNFPKNEPGYLQEAMNVDDDLPIYIPRSSRYKNIDIDKLKEKIYYKNSDTDKEISKASPFLNLADNELIWQAAKAQKKDLIKVKNKYFDNNEISNMPYNADLDEYLRKLEENKKQ